MQVTSRTLLIRGPRIWASPGVLLRPMLSKQPKATMLLVERRISGRRSGVGAILRAGGLLVQPARQGLIDGSSMEYDCCCLL